MKAKEEKKALHKKWQRIKQEALDALSGSLGYEDHPKVDGFLHRATAPAAARSTASAAERCAVHDKIVGMRPVFGCGKWVVAILVYNGNHPPGRRTTKFLLRPSLPHHTRSYPWLHDVGIALTSHMFDLEQDNAHEEIIAFIKEQHALLNLNPKMRRSAAKVTRDDQR